MTATVSGDAGLLAHAVVQRGEFTLDVELLAAGGQTLGIVGPNGAGKSTLLNALSGLISLDHGSIRLGDTVLDDPLVGVFVPASQRRIGFLFQDYRLFPHLTVIDNVAFGLRCQGVGRRRARAAAAPWLERLDINQLADHRPGQLSGGQAQRVAVARALAAQPALLLLDEPLAALDVLTRLQVRIELRRHLSQFGGPSVIVTHDPLEAMLLADTLIVVEAGRVVQRGTPAEVARRPRTRYIASLLGLNLYAGRLTGDGAVRMPGGAILFTAPLSAAPLFAAPLSAAPPGMPAAGLVLVAIRPTAISLHVRPPVDASPRNVWAANIEGLEPLAEPGRVRVSTTGELPALVDITVAAAGELALVPGMPVWLSAKATEMEVYPGLG